MDRKQNISQIVKRQKKLDSAILRRITSVSTLEKHLSRTAQLWTMWEAMPWGMCKNIITSQNKIYKEEKKQTSKQEM